MNIERIGRLLADSLPFALWATAGYALVRLIRLKRKVERPRRELALLAFVFYLSTLISITAVRGGFSRNPDGNRLPVNFALLATTAGAARQGLGAFVYHVFGNILWFVPLGLLPPALWRGRTLLRAALAGLGLSVAIELTQWLFATGMLDVDDMLLNTLGAALGFCAYSIAKRARPSGRKHTQ